MATSSLARRMIVRHPQLVTAFLLARPGRLTTIIAVMLCPGCLMGSPARAQTGASRLDEQVFEAYRRAEPLTSWPLKKLLHEIPELKGLEFGTDQSALPGILNRVGDNVKALLANFVNTTSLETIDETRVRNYPDTQDGVVQRFRYLMMLNHDDLGDHLIEYRTDPHGREERPGSAVQGFIKTTGFASMPLYFGPNRQALSDFRYLGSETVEGRRAEVVAFAEHPEPKAALGGIVLAGATIPAIYQGLAWIDSPSGQILRMRIDLLAPQLVIGLARETTDVRFQEVHFPKQTSALWLPEEVDVTMVWQGVIYTNRHRYSDYEIFNVSTDQQIGGPKADSRP